MAKRTAAHPTLLTGRLRLRQFRADDTDAMHACFADREAMRYWDKPAHSKRSETERSVRSFIDCTPIYYRFWAVADVSSDHCIGMVNYHDGHMRTRRATIGYIIQPIHQRQGIATEAVSALLDFCFEGLDLHRVQAFIDPANAASRGVLTKLGFRAEGVLRQNRRVGGKWFDDELYARLKTDAVPRFDTTKNGR